MGKARTDKKGYTREQRLIKENQQLKRQVSALRKQLARVDLDRYDTVKEIIELHYQDEKAQQGQEILENLKKIWACKECDGHLEIKLYSKMGETWYFRQCNNCSNRTKGKKYDNKTVKGIVSELGEDE